MGSWDGTCGISHLPIRSGEPVVAYLIIESNGINELQGAGYCYSWDIFKPCMLPVYADYNDYGSIEGVQNEDAVLKRIKYLLSSEKIKFNKYIEHEMTNEKLEHMTAEDFFHYVERGWVDGAKGKKLGFIMFHKELYDKLHESHDGVYAIEMIERIIDMIDTFTKMMCDENTSPEEKAVIIKRNASCLLPVGHGGYMSYLAEDIEDYYLTRDEEIKQSLCEILTTSSLLDILRVPWIPQVGAGGQTWDYKEYKVLSQFIQDHLAEIDKEWEDMEEEE